MIASVVILKFGWHFIETGIWRSTELEERAFPYLALLHPLSSPSTTTRLNQVRVALLPVLCSVEAVFFYGG